MTVMLAVATQPCIGCGEGSIVQVDPARYARWIAGEFVQDVWPEWTDAQRELLITGTHPECWDEMFPPTCDICGEPQHDGEEGEDWNGETGNHRSCELSDSTSLMRYSGAMVKANPGRESTGLGGMPEEDDA